MLFYGISFHKKLLELETTGGDAVTQSGKSFDDLKNEVDELSPRDISIENDKIKDVDRLCTLELANELSGKQEEVKSMLNTIEEWLKKPENKNSDARNSVTKLRDFLQSIVAQTQFKFDNREEVVQSTDDDGSGGNPIDMVKINNTIEEYKNRIDELIGNSNISVDVKPTLDNIKKVLDNPSNKSYVKQLQEYLYNSVYKNLSDKTIFVQKNGEEKDGNFQGNGNISSLLESGALNVILDRIEKGQQSLNVGGVVYQREQLSSIKVIAGSSSSLSGVNLYSVSSGPSHDGNESGEQAQTRELPEIDSLRTALHVEKGETMYLMKVGDKTYAVKLDSQNYLSPIAVDVTKGLNSTETVYFKNNPSCIGYLRNKIPSNVRNYFRGVDIIWDGSDYAIGVPGTKMLTIEPMTLNGEWISKNLGECLSMLCFVNYLRNNKGIDGYEFDNDNPDLSWKDGENDNDGKLLVAIKKSEDKAKRKEAKEQSGSKHKALVDLQRFSLDFLSSKDNSEVRRKFLKYNNGEDWEDNWDKKKENKRISNRVDLSEELAKNDYVEPATPGQAIGGGNGGSRVSGGSGVEAPSYPFVHSLNDNWLLSNAGKYGIKSENSNYPQVYQYGGDGTNLDLCYQKNNTIVKISHESYWMRQIGTGTISTSGLQNFNQSNEELNVCEKGAEQLNNELKGVRREMFGQGVDVPSGLIIDVGESDYNLKWGGDDGKIISLKNVLLDDDFCGIKKDDEKCLQRRLKIVLLAYEHYDQIMDGNHVTLTAAERETYEVNTANKDVFLSWVKKLGGNGNESLDVVFLPSVDEIKSMGKFNQNGQFVFNDNVEKKDDSKTFIEIGGNKYYKDEGKGLMYEFDKKNKYIYFGENVSASSGYGIIYYSSGTSYQGGWSNNARDGIGKTDNAWVVNTTSS